MHACVDDICQMYYKKYLLIIKRCILEIYTKIVEISSICAQVYMIVK